MCDPVCLVDTNISEETATAIFRLISTVKIKAVGSYETLEPMYQTTRHHTQDYHIKIYISPTFTCGRNCVMPATYELEFSVGIHSGHGLREASSLATLGVLVVVWTVIRPPSACHSIVVVWFLLTLASSTALLPGWLSVSSGETVVPEGWGVVLLTAGGPIQARA